MASEQGAYERYVRESVEAVYGAGSTVHVDGDESGGQIRVLGPDDKRVAGWYWDRTSTSQRTQEQAWFALADAVRDDERARAKRR